MFETETANLRSKGLIDSNEQESVNRVIGHSPETARKTYILKNDDHIRKQRQLDAHTSTRIMEQFENPSDRVVIDYEKIIQKGKL
jgi:intergrase/recombinase